MRKKSAPKYRRQCTAYNDLAFVELGGKRHYLGLYDTPESRAKYHRLLAEWSAVKPPVAVGPKQVITIGEICAQFWDHAKSYYRKPDGTHTSEIDNFRQVIRPLRELYSFATAASFGPKALKTVRQKWIEGGLCRSLINKHTSRLKMIFKWSVEQELIEPSVWHGLQAVSGFRRGRTEVRESEPVKPVPMERVNAVLPYVSNQVWAIIQLQILTAARAGELVTIKGTDIDTSGPVWLYRPTEHKTAHHGHQRIIYLGPQAQEILRPFLQARPIGSYLFSPVDAEHARYAEAKGHRRPNQKPNPRKSGRVLGQHYETASYRRAITRACEKAKVTAWHPHQLRHNAATELRRQFGIDAARVILGHRSAAITEVYAELDREKAVQIMKSIG